MIVGEGELPVVTGISKCVYRQADYLTIKNKQKRESFVGVFV